MSPDAGHPSIHVRALYAHIICIHLDIYLYLKFILTSLHCMHCNFARAELANALDEKLFKTIKISINLLVSGENAGATHTHLLYIDLSGRTVRNWIICQCKCAQVVSLYYIIYIIFVRFFFFRFRRFIFNQLRDYLFIRRTVGCFVYRRPLWIQLCGQDWVMRSNGTVGWFH